MHRLLLRGGGLVSRGLGRGGERRGGRGRLGGRLRGRAEGGRGGGGLRRRGEPGRTGGLGRDLLLRRRLLLGDLAAEVLQERGEPAVETLADGGEAPYVLQVEVTDHQRALGAELRTGEGVADDFLAACHDPDVARADL